MAGKHANARGLVHGGVLLTLADAALGHTSEGSVNPPVCLITAIVSADFAGRARVGGRLAFAGAYCTWATDESCGLEPCSHSLPSTGGRLIDRQSRGRTLR